MPVASGMRDKSRRVPGSRALQSTDRGVSMRPVTPAAATGRVIGSGVGSSDRAPAGLVGGSKRPVVVGDRRSAIGRSWRRCGRCARWWSSPRAFGRQRGRRVESEDPALTNQDGIFDVVALASYTANTPVALRPPASRIDDRQQSGRRRITARDRTRIVELYKQGRSARYVASDVGVSKATVLTTLKRAGVEMRPVGAHY